MPDPIEQLIIEAEIAKGEPLTGEEVDAIVQENLDPNAPPVDPDRLVYINPVTGDN